MMTTKDSVLSALIRADDYISGEQISNDLGLSRVAVNVAVKALRSDGYDIDSATKKGYILKRSPNTLSVGEISAYLPGRDTKEIIVLDSVDSTNTRLKELASQGAPQGTVVIAKEQTKGKGRLGRTFVSPPGTGIYLSYLLRPDSSPADTACVTAKTAVAISEAINTVCGIRPGIKWVNDLVINSRKICGILTEMTLESESGLVDSVIIGIGINANHHTSDFPEELRQTASSVKLESGNEVPLSRLAAEMIKEMDNLLIRDDHLTLYRENCITIGKEVSVVRSHISGETPRHGKAVTVNDDYSLKVRFEDGHEEDLQSGEISVRGLYGYV